MKKKMPTKKKTASKLKRKPVSKYGKGGAAGVLKSIKKRYGKK